MSIRFIAKTADSISEAAGIYIGIKKLTNDSNLSTTLDSLPDADGKRAIVKSYKILVQLYSYGAFNVTPAVVQTAGTLTEGLAASNLSKINELLDDRIDDDLGYQILSQTRQGIPVMSVWNGASFFYHYRCSLIIDIPKKIINLLNKESQTERLQELLCVLCVQLTASQTLYIQKTEVIEFIETAKTITIR